MPKQRIGDIPLAFSTGVRLDQRDRQQLEQLAQEKQMPRNALIREAIRKFLSQPHNQEQKKNSVAVC
jgi:predicted transcriptional regulator